jgi:protein-S-isoprenylcysteine O-methyltransferase Ste14/uncharacterized membrane protein YdjX (TVP38/TMEM64 family)
MSLSPHSQPTDTSNSSNKLWVVLRPLLFGVFLAGIVCAIWWFDLVRFMSVAGMRELVDASAPFGPLLFMLIVVAGLFTRVPMMGTVLVAVGAVLFGELAAFVYGWLAALAGTTAIFVLVRLVTRDYAKRMLDARPGRLQVLDERITRNGFRTVLGLRLVFGLAPMLNWGLGLTGVRALHCFAATAIGIVPNLAFAVLFADTISNGLVTSGTLLRWFAVDEKPELVTAFRAASLLAFAGLMLLNVGGRDRKRSKGADQRHGDRTPVLANFAAFGLFFSLMIAFVGSAEGPVALPLAICGCILAVVGSIVVVLSRRELGSAWSFAPMVGQSSGLVTSGPYRIVRHPIYLGLSLLAIGQAVAFAGWPAIAAVFLAIVPTFLWRARAEETLLTRTHGDRYDQYRGETKLMIPYLL